MPNNRKIINVNYLHNAERRTYILLKVVNLCRGKRLLQDSWQLIRNSY